MIITFFLFLATLVGNYYKFSPFALDIHISFLDIVVVFITILNFKKIRFPVFVIVALISLFTSFHYGFHAISVGFLYLCRWLIYINLFYTLPKNPRLFGWLSLAMLVTAISQYVVFPDIRSLQVAEWDPHYFRVVGTLLDPGFMGLLLVFMLIYAFFHKQTQKLLVFFTYFAFAFTYSRASYLALIATFVYLSFVRKSWKPFVITLLVMIMTIVLLPRSSNGEGVKLERTSSIQARITNWRNSFEIFASSPIIGTGFNTYRYTQKQFGFLDDSKWLKSHAGAGADSSLLFVLATTGIVGLIIYLRFYQSLWLKSSPPIRACLVALFVHSFFLNSQFYPFVLLWLAALSMADMSQSSLVWPGSRLYLWTKISSRSLQNSVDSWLRRFRQRSR